MKVFLDCDDCFADFLRSEIEFVDYVRDRTEAEVHVLITRAETGSGGGEYTLAFIGRGRFSDVTETLKTVTESSDTDDIVRRQLANARAGRAAAVPDARRRAARAWRSRSSSAPSSSGPRSPATAGTTGCSASRARRAFAGEESSRSGSSALSVSADRITPNWKITFGGEIDHETEEFDLDEEEPVEVERRERDFNWLVVKALGEHWSLGAQGEIESSTFDNTELAVAAAPAVEFNFFPYSMYTRRQLRAQYAVGVRRFRYYEETLYGKLEETLPEHELSLTLEQRERWGSLEASIEWSQYLHDLSKSRLEASGELSLRLARGLSVGAELNASRIRDQLSLPARGATDEEVLLRLRRLQSGYEYSLSRQPHLHLRLDLQQHREPDGSDSDCRRRQEAGVAGGRRQRQRLRS